MILDALIFRAAARNALRALVTLASIAVTVAVVVAVRAAAAGALGTFASGVDVVAGTVTFSVVGNERAFDERTLFALRRSAAIAAAEPVVDGTIALTAPAERVRVEGRDLLRPLPGDADPRPRFAGPFAPARDEPTRTLLAEPSVMLSHRVAAAHGVRAGGVVRALVRGRPLRLRVAAVLPATVASADAGVAFMDIGFAQAAFEKRGLVDRIDCTAAAGDADAARESAAHVLPPDARIVDPGAERRGLRRLLQRTTGDIRALAAFVAVLAACIVHAAAATGVAQRTRDVGALRALGADRTQILAAFAFEGLAFGVLGSAVGLELGATVLLPLAGGAAFDARAMLGAAALGTVLSLAAALVPALRAASIAPADATRDASGARGGRQPVAAAAAAALLLATVFFESGATAAAAATLGVLVCGAFAVPAALRAAVAALRGSAARHEPAARLAAQGIEALGARNAVALGAGALAVAFAVSVAVVLATFERDAAAAVARAFPGDIAVRVRTPGIAPQLAARFRALPGVRASVVTGGGDVAVTARAGVDLGTLRERIAAAAAPLDAAVESTRDLRGAADAVLRTPLRLGEATALLALGCAAFGIAATLAGLVLERRDEIRVLRYVGMSAAAVRAMVAWQAGVLGVLSALIGIPLGTLAAAVVLALGGSGAAHLAVPYAALAVLPFAVVVVALLAALPAGRAAGRIAPDGRAAGA